MKIISLDTESTGVDLYHSARPFYVVSAERQTGVTFWEWKVDPLTRKVLVSQEDVKEIQRWVDSADVVVGHNFKFDMGMLASIGVHVPWEKVHDTIIADHVLASNQFHNLTDVTLRYLYTDIEKYELKLEQIVQQCRRDSRRDNPTWLIASKGLTLNGEELMPSAREKTWKYDLWLPSAIADHDNLPDDHEYRTSLRKYANIDAEATLALWQGSGTFMGMEKLLKKHDLWEIYLTQLKLSPICHRMKSRGLTYSGERADTLRQQVNDLLEDSTSTCMGIANLYNYPLNLPKSPTSPSLSTFVFDHLKLPVVKKTENDNPSMDKEAFRIWNTTLDNGTPEKVFLNSLLNRRKAMGANNFLDNYERFAIGLHKEKQYHPHNPAVYTNWHVLHPSVNQTGTDTLRFSFSNPNSSNLCFDGDTELLTRNGWVRASEMNEGVEVAQYWKETGEIDFTLPQLHSPHYKGVMKHITTHDYIDMCLTPSHRCLLRNRKTRDYVDIQAKDFRSDYQHIHAGEFPGGKETLTQSQVTWICAVQADGSYVRANGATYGVVFSFSKKRKTTRLLWCLSKLGANYSVKEKATTTTIYVSSKTAVVQWVKQLMPNKTLGPWLLNYDRITMDRFCSELFLWDGDSVTKARYTSSIKENVDWAQILFTLSSRRCWQYSSFPDGVHQHHFMSVHQTQDYSLTTNFQSQDVPWNDKVYCVTVPSSYVVTRRNGKVSITGNSKTGVDGSQEYSLRYAFGPLPGREWWAFDYANIELRIPAYASGQRELIELFEKYDHPPYYGSEHMLNFSVVYPDIWEAELKEVGPEKVSSHIKKKYKDTYYQWCKNGDFGLQYNCGEATADRTFRRPGSFKRLKSKFFKKEALNQKCIRQAEKLGYVETMPDKTVNPRRGYPLLCTRTDSGGILPTVPLAYMVSGTAMWCTRKGMLRVDQQLREWRHTTTDGKNLDSHLILQVHDELVVDMPFSPERFNLKTNKKEPGNSDKARQIRKLMEMSGDDIGVPLKVEINYHVNNYATGELII